MPIALFIFGLTAAFIAWHVHHPVRRPGELAAAMFASAWIAGELPFHVGALFTGVGVALIAAGGLDQPIGYAGLGALIVSGLGPVSSWREATRARAALSAALGRPVRGEVSLLRYLVPVHVADRDVVATPGLVRENDRLRADLYVPRSPPPGGGPRPLLVYVHGGGWVLGFRRWQGRLLIRRLVKAGWVAVSVQYRLSPWATWPAHIIDVKRSIVWAKAMAPSWGADPSRIALSGNSAGGHLAALAAFSPGFAPWQPGFEREDTSVAALVGWYGIYDLVAAVDGSPLWPHGGLRRLWRLLVMKRALATARDDYHLASPATHFGPQAPPTLLVHGALDTLVPVASARAFAAECDKAVPGRVTYFEVPGAEHAFEVFYSRRAVVAVEAAAMWLEDRLGSRPHQGF